jgi:hypothetical protein
MPASSPGDHTVLADSAPGGHPGTGQNDGVTETEQLHAVEESGERNVLSLGNEIGRKAECIVDAAGAGSNGEMWGQLECKAGAEAIESSDAIRPGLFLLVGMLAIDDSEQWRIGEEGPAGSVGAPQPVGEGEVVAGIGGVLRGVAAFNGPLVGLNRVEAAIGPIKVEKGQGSAHGGFICPPGTIGQHLDVRDRKG